MPMLAVRRPRVKPTRVGARVDLPFGWGVLTPLKPAAQVGPIGPTSPTDDSPWTAVKCSPIDSRVLPDISGRGLEPGELARIVGCMNRARAAYAFDVPSASLAEIDQVARKAAVDELRRTLKDRPAAPPLKPASQPPAQSPTPRVAAQVVSQVEAKSVEAKASRPRRFEPSRSERLWWAEHSPTRNERFDVVGRCPVVGDEPEVSDFDAWQADGCPDPEPELTAAGTWA